MPNVIANDIRGSLIELIRNGEDLIVVLLKTAQADDTLRDYNDLAAALAAGGGTANVEADFTNYTREVILNASTSITIDDTANEATIDYPDVTWSPAGNGTNNTLVKYLNCVDGASDAARRMGTLHDFATTTDGNDLTAVIDSAGFYASTD